MLLIIHQARAEDFPALEQLLELYQYDLSDIWPQDLDSQGRYGFDLSRHRRAEGSRAYIAKCGSQYAGFALTAPAIVTRTEGTWMEQFFILKRYRRTGAGTVLAKHVFSSHPGLSPAWRLFAVTGFLGGLTTFSSFSAESMVLLQRGDIAWALAHSLLHLVGALICCFAGFAAYRALSA